MATTIEAIAREADVAVPTLYFTFRKKGAMLGEALGAAVMGLDEPVGPKTLPRIEPSRRSGIPGERSRSSSRTPQ